MTRVAETGVPDADYEAAAAEFSDKELADLTYAIGLMNAFNRFGISFRSTPRRGQSLDMSQAVLAHGNARQHSLPQAQPVLAVPATFRRWRGPAA